MKLSRNAIFGIILLFVLAIGAYALFSRQGSSNFRSESGFRGLKWGAPISEHEYRKPSDFMESLGSILERSEYFKAYTTYREKALGNVPVNQVFYYFLIDNGVEKFESVELTFGHILGFDTQKYEESRMHKVLDALTKEYGKYTEEGDSAKNKKYIFENDYVNVYYRPELGVSGNGLIKISSKEMRSRYSKIYEKAEKDARKKAEEEAEKEARRKADF